MTLHHAERHAEIHPTPLYSPIGELALLAEEGGKEGPSTGESKDEVRSIPEMESLAPGNYYHQSNRTVSASV